MDKTPINRNERKTDGYTEEPIKNPVNKTQTF